MSDCWWECGGCRARLLGYDRQPSPCEECGGRFERIARAPAEPKDATTLPELGWMPEERETPTRCKHGTASCALCGTVAGRDVVHTARTPNKRDARRARRKAAR